ncbi:isochorismatase family protein [Schlesneria sp. T3-172]|uniref:isochorismatase family protein n=1 Tax=Schlesneria TaxID=656899 RepID=UPI002EFE879D
MNGLRSHELLHRRSSRLLIVDIQEKLVAALDESARFSLVDAVRILAASANLLQIPVVATEQYPSGLGPTVAPLTKFTDVRPPKKRFSATESTGWPTAAEATDDRFQIVVTGMESHVCVLQTVMDLLALGYQTYVVADGVTSRRSLDHRIALERMANAGAIITTAESVVFEWCESAEAPEFKQLSSLVKSRPV